MNKKFISIMKIYLLNSWLYCINIFINGAIWLATTKVQYNNDNFIFPFYTSYEFMFYLCYICFNMGYLTYIFGSLWEMYITWERIQVIRPQYKFVSKTPVNIILVVPSLAESVLTKSLCFKVHTVSLAMLVISILFSLPSGISREVQTVEFILNDNNTNTTLTLHTYGKVEYLMTIHLHSNKTIFFLTF